MSKVKYIGVGMAVIAGLFACGAARAQWRQWGGEDNSFRVEKADLDTDWSGEDEPNLLWEKEIGSGQGSVLVDRARGFIHFREGQEEVVIAVDLISGQTLWRTSYAAPIPDGFPAPQELGPRATPAISNTRLFTLGSLGHIYAFDVANGNIFWSFDPVGEFALVPPKTGYTASPLIFKDRVMYALGSEGATQEAGLLVFHQSTGTFLWRRHPVEPVIAPPTLIDVDGKQHLVLATSNAVLGLNPYMGQELWRFDHDQPYTPRWVDYRSTLFIPSTSPAGSAAILLEADGTSFKVKPLWRNANMQVEQSVSMADRLYAAGAIDGKSAMFRAGIGDGQITWKGEDFARGYVIYANGRFLILDQDGTLALANESGGTLEVETKTTIQPKGRFAAPSLDQGRLYLRDNARVLAFNLNATQYPFESGKDKKTAPKKVERESK